MFRLNPITRKKLHRFRQIRRGYFSFVVLATLVLFSVLAELFINNRALVVRYDGQWFFPTYGPVRMGSEFGLEGVGGQTPVNYRELKERFRSESGAGNWVVMPIIPYSPYENISYGGVFRATAPSWERLHLFGTDGIGRDIFARTVYGFRIAIFFALAYLCLTYLIGIIIGCIMGYYGGIFDLVVQRIIEVWSNIPFLYMVIIIFSVVPSTVSVPNRIGILLSILVLFSWIGMTYYMRTATYREKAKDYAAAALVLGASPARVIFRHILPNSLSTIVTFMPFTIVGAITSITALDFLGFGLPPPTPSIGELLKQGTGNLSTAPWIVIAAFATLTLTLTLVTFIGEAVREAFDPRKFTLYQ